MEQLLEKIREAEEHFVMYRWYEHKIRLLYYGPLWQARQEQRDPLIRDKRVRGEKEEKHLLQQLDEYLEKSRSHANELFKFLKAMESMEADFSACHQDVFFRGCLQNVFKEVRSISHEMLQNFDRIFESERDFQREVSVTSGRRDGLYPKDALEDPASHGDYYDRFEMEREPGYFEENHRMIHAFRRLHGVFGISLMENHCCYHDEGRETLVPSARSKK